MSMNRIKKMEGFSESLAALERLTLYGNEIAKIEGLELLGQSSSSLRVLDLSRNKISDTLHLVGAQNQGLRKTLEVLNASHNLIGEDQIDNIARFISSLQSLKSLDLYGNPLCSEATYKFRLSAASSLERLDGFDLKPGSFIRGRLDTLRKEWETAKLVEETHEQAQKWIEAER